jgi:hypothetical protein
MIAHQLNKNWANKIALMIENSQELCYFTKFNHKMDKLIRFLEKRKINLES